MSAEENKAIVRRFWEEVFNQRNLGAAAEIVAPEYVGHFGGMPEPVRGRDAWEEVAASYHAGFPDLHTTIDDMIAEGDKVTSRVTDRGTHGGTFLGIPATGRRVTVTTITIQRIADGTIAEEWVEVDMLGLLQQLGAIPAPGQPGA